ncbi:MAG: hypothetical protein QE271_00965 [Bacteriovoracaceae bacterium]|nr:hypothetical protein [Bacteriovoracaceae bacterium]
MKKIYLLLLLSFSKCANAHSSFPIGMNLWQAIIWALPDHVQGGDRNRLHRELSTLEKNHIKILRIMASVQGSDDSKVALGRILPSCEERPGEWKVECQEALVYLLNAIDQHHMKAILVISNFWHWSGGFSQYLAWDKKLEAIPFAFGADSSYWEMKKFFETSVEFYENQKAQNYYFEFLEKVVRLVNGHPAIACWQLANEPTPWGEKNFSQLLAWAKDATKRVRNIDQRACVSLGGVGSGPLPFFGTYTDLRRLHQEIKFDWMTVHLWPQNWGWYFPRPEWAAKISWPIMKWLSHFYITYHAELAKELGIPMVLEEVGLARDGESLSADAGTERRDAFFSFIKEELERAMSEKGIKVSGLLFWSWAGESRPIPGKRQWEKGDAMLGDPPQEPQGWYSIYNSDLTTLKKIH